MKKKLIAALLVAILASTMVFAEVTLSGDAETTFGYTFNTKLLGFTNASSAKATFSAVAKTSANEGDVYAEIKATLKIKAVEATGASLTVESLAVDYAKIIGDGWYVGILGCMDPADLAVSFEAKGSDKVNYALSATKPAGIEVNVDKIGTFGIGLVADLNKDARKQVMLDAKTADFEVAEGLKLKAAATYAYDSKPEATPAQPTSAVGGGVKVAYAKDAISVDVAADIGVTLANETKVNYDVAANAAYNNIKASLYYASLVTKGIDEDTDNNAIAVAVNEKNHLAAKVYVDFRDFDLPFALTVLGQDLINKQYLDAKFELFVVEGLTLTANGGYYNGKNEWHAGAGASYVINDIGTLAGKVKMKGDKDNSFSDLKAEVSLTNTTLVSGATLKAAYESGNYLAKDDTGKSAPDFGKVYVSAKITL